jgi:hypothetical protein
LRARVSRSSTKQRLVFGAEYYRTIEASEWLICWLVTRQDELDDDSALQQYRAKRIAELREKAVKERFGDVRDPIHMVHEWLGQWHADFCVRLRTSGDGNNQGRLGEGGDGGQQVVLGRGAPLPGQVGHRATLYYPRLTHRAHLVSRTLQNPQP